MFFPIPGRNFFAQSSLCTNFNELCADYNHFTRLYTDGSKMGDGVASAVVIVYDSTFFTGN